MERLNIPVVEMEVAGIYGVAVSPMRRREGITIDLSRQTRDDIALERNPRL